MWDVNYGLRSACDIVSVENYQIAGIRFYVDDIAH